MKKNELQKIVEKAIKETDTKKIKDIFNYEWDSLMQLNILTILQNKYKKKISHINELGSVKSLKSLLNILRKKNIIE